MQRVNIPIKQSWDTLDEAIQYFLDLVLDLAALKRLPEQPTDLFLFVDSQDPEIKDKLHNNDLSITFENL